MRPVNIRLDRRQFVVKRIAYKTLRREMIALVRPNLFHDGVNTGIAFQGAGVKN
jgi:hypothetical protein